MNLLIYAPSGLGKTTLLNSSDVFNHVFDTDFLIPLLDEFPKVRLFDDKTLYSRLFDTTKSILQNCDNICIISNLSQIWMLCERTIIFKRSIEDQIEWFIKQGVESEKADKWAQSIEDSVEDAPHVIYTLPAGTFLTDYSDNIKNTIISTGSTMMLTQFKLARDLFIALFGNRVQQLPTMEEDELREQLRYDFKTIFNATL